MGAEIALQKSLRTRLITSQAVTAMVPADNILDRNQRPAPDPSIIIGEGQTIDEGESIARLLSRIFMDVHVWKKEQGLGGTKAIAITIRAAVMSRRMDLGDGYSCADLQVIRTRYLRDPDGETGHAVVTISALVEEMP